MPVRTLLFDLFGTVVHFAARVPIIEVAGSPWVTTMGWLRPLAEAKLPGVDFDALLAALMATTEEIVRARPPEYREVASSERFRRALLKVGVGAAEAVELARQLSLVHMQHLASTTFLPDGYAAVLAELQQTYRLGLVSNFDHAATAHAILRTHGVAGFFEPTLISEEFGRRKPHRSIFEAACARLGVSSNEAVFIGDNPKEDIAGAQAAGLTTVWVCGPDKEPPPKSATAYAVRDLHELPTLLRQT